MYCGVFMNINSAYLLFAVFILVIFAPGSFASDQPQRSISDYIIGYEDKLIPHDEGPGAKRIFKDTSGKVVSDKIYEVPTVQALSLMYWGVGLYKPADDKAVDLFVLTNECDIYKKYISNDLQWKDIREATRNYIIANKSEFPTSFEFVIPLMLDNYDEKKSLFFLNDSSRINSVRRFEVFATNYQYVPCVKSIPKFDQYPRALVLEFSRPLNLTSIPMSEDVAKDYIASVYKKAEQRNYLKPGESPNDYMIRRERTAFLVLKVKIFTHGRFLGVNNYHVQSVQMLAVLEGYEVYDNIARDRLLYSQSFISNRGNSGIAEELSEQFKILEEMAAGKGILNSNI